MSVQNLEEQGKALRVGNLAKYLVTLLGPELVEGFSSIAAFFDNGLLVFAVADFP